MQKLLNHINSLKKSKVSDVVAQRMEEFHNQKDLFGELSFCLMAFNFNAARSMMMQDAIGDGFHSMRRPTLAKELRRLGHRFPNKRAEFIVGARKNDAVLSKKLKELKGEERRQWLIDNFKGMGMKSASHFLRNIGYKDYAILDFHIIDLLERYKIIKRPKTLTPKKYLEIEHVLENIASKTGLSLGELDMYLWYEETGKILK